MAESPGDLLALADYKRRVFELYRRVREEPDPAAAARLWRATRDELFAQHPQSPLPAAARTAFTGLAYFDRDPALRVLATVVPAEPQVIDIGSSGEAPIRFIRFARAEFALSGDNHALDLFWLEGYGGGLFLPFRDGTCGHQTYGGGRYLTDTVKGTHGRGLTWLGQDTVRLDFNYAYNPSCAYDPRWVCPLAPPPNRLPLPIRAGERMP